MKAFALVALGLALTGCAAPGQQQATQASQKFDATYINQNLVSGKTSSSDVISRFGAPDSRSVSGTGEERWTYRRQASAGSSGSLMDSLPASLKRRLNNTAAKSEYGSDVLGMADSLLSGEGDGLVNAVANNGSAAPSPQVDSLTIYLRKDVVSRFDY
ncbi:hypothetical protein [Pseudomonas sp. UBA6310]|uniref:hypothetical protein n=1 Tax=Pseudomonas sp. UBA6310 TaxID=1947327 RepID=UPI00257C586D|nr:hypothetical protein [Pseudomonas sp. UBA6310]